MISEQQCEVLYKDRIYTISADETRIVIRRKPVDWWEKLGLIIPSMMNLIMLSACLFVFGLWVILIIDIVSGKQVFDWGAVFLFLFLSAWWGGGMLLTSWLMRQLCTFLFGCEKWLEDSEESVCCGLRLIKRLVIKRKLQKPVKLIATVAPMKDSGWSSSLQLKGERGLGTTLVTHVSAKTKTKACEKLEKIIAAVGSQIHLPVEWKLHKRRR